MKRWNVLVGFATLSVIVLTTSSNAANAQSFTDLLKQAQKKLQSQTQQNPSSAVQPATSSQSEPAVDPTTQPAEPFRMPCDAVEKVFTSSCVGRFEGVIGGFDPRARGFPDDLKSAVKAMHIAVVNTHPLNGPDKSWKGMLCQLMEQNVRWYPKDIPADPIVSVALMSCNLGNATWHLQDIVVYNLPDGPVIGELTGVYKANVGNSASEGPFHDTLVQRYGPKNCDGETAAEYCRSDKTRITVSPGPGDNEFTVTLSDDGVSNRALLAAQERAKKLKSQASVNAF